MKHIFNEITKSRQESVTLIESFYNLNELVLNFNLKRNESIHLEWEMFTEFKNLTKLHINLNVSNECFKCLTNLKELKLSNQSLDTFVGLDKLEKLYLFQCAFSYEIFTQLTNLRDLTLDKCNTGGRVEITALEKLESLIFVFNFPTCIEKSVFSKLVNLRTLKLLLPKKTRKIDSITVDKDAFKGLLNLKLLELNKTSFCFESDFYLPQLQTLVLYGCIVTKIKNNAFLNLKNLTELNFTKSFFDLERNSFNGLENLKHFTLSSCSIMYENELSDNDLSTCFLRCGPFVESLLKGLETLNLSLNLNLNFTSLQNFTRDALKILNLSNCFIDTLPNEAFVLLKNLESLDLSKNKHIKFQKNCFIGLDRLKRLDLSRNSCDYCYENRYNKCFPIIINENTFLGLKSLELLDLSKNLNLKICSNAFQTVKYSLKCLLIRDSSLSNINNVFTGLDCLEGLDLKQNYYLNLNSNSFNGLPALKELNISQCNVDDALMFNGLKNTKIINKNRRY